MALFAETAVTDPAGETITRAGAVGVIVKAVVEPIPPDTAGRSQPASMPRYRLRLVSDTPPVAGLFQAQWRGSRWNVEGDGSPLAARAEYTMVRARCPLMYRDAVETRSLTSRDSVS